MFAACSEKNAWAGFLAESAAVAKILPLGVADAKFNPKLIKNWDKSGLVFLSLKASCKASLGKNLSSFFIVNCMITYRIKI